MVNRVRRSLNIPVGSGETSGFGVKDAAGVLAVDFGATVSGSTTVPDHVVVAMEWTGGLAVGSVLNIRRRFTIAEVNAGATLLPAKQGYKYRMVRGSAIAIGGAATAVTTVDILGTQSASGVKLVAFAQASLTQNTQLDSGASGAAILAGGVSYVANDANTAITVGKTGSSVATATHIDINFSFVVEKA